jgi:O-methyltransferase
MKLLNRPRMFNIIKTEFPWDFVRYSSLELVAYELNANKIEGNLAEVGVYKGEFASKINRCFPDRKLYLFDTFEGLPEQDLKRDKIYKLIHSKRTFIHPDINTVLSKMKYPEKCEIRKGYFPDTLNNLEDKFSFVSLDADLFNPIYNGLQYFYPRLSKGGFIFVHDYNNYKFGGSKDAVRKYCKENKINFFPLSDINGSAIIIK